MKRGRPKSINKDWRTPGFNTRSGDFVIGKGGYPKNKQMKLSMYDACQECSMEDCPAFKVCNYEKRPAIKCGFMRRYVDSIIDLLMRNTSFEDELQLYRVGMHLIPLYRNLCKLQIYEIGIERPVHLTPKGSYQINPVYSEIRQSITQIERAWASIGLHDIMVNNLLKLGKPAPAGSNGTMEGIGNDFEEPLDV